MGKRRRRKAKKRQSAEERDLIEDEAPSTVNQIELERTQTSPEPAEFSGASFDEEVEIIGVEVVPGTLQHKFLIIANENAQYAVAKREENSNLKALLENKEAEILQLKIQLEEDARKSKAENDELKDKLSSFGFIEEIINELKIALPTPEELSPEDFLALENDLVKSLTTHL